VCVCHQQGVCMSACVCHQHGVCVCVCADSTGVAVLGHLIL